VAADHNVRMGIGQGTAEVVGRRTELDLLSGVLSNLDRGTGVTILLRGDVGIGKTTLLDWVATQTTGAVIRLTGSESDAELAYSGLASLTKSIKALDVTIPAQHAQVLSDASGSGSTQGQLTVAGATLAALAATCEQGPLLLLIDDAQWLDDPSCAALAFALRRLHDEPVVAVVTERSDEASTFDNAGFERIELKGLNVDDAITLLGDDTDRAVAQRLVDAAEGSPLALSEIARLLDRDQLAGRSALPINLPVGNQLVGSFVGRISALDDRAKQALAVVAAALDATADDIHGAADRFSDGTTSGLAVGEAAGIVRVTPESIELTHPLMRTAIRDSVGPEAMRAAHAALAQVVEDADKRAWHLAAATIGPDEAVAAELEQVALVADQRGAWAAAAVTWERAAALSIDVAERHRRLLGAGTSRWNASDPYAAIAVLEEVVARCDDPLVRCDAIGIRSEGVAWMIDQARGVDELAAEAERISAIDPSRSIGLFIRAALHSGLAGRPLDCQRLAQSAVDAAEPLGMPMLIVAQAVRAMSSQRLGDRDGAETEFDLVSILGSLPIEMLDAKLLPVLQTVALTKLSQERWHEANDMLDVSMTAARYHGLASVLGFSGALQGELFLRRGRLTDAVLSSVLDVDLNNTPDLPTASFGQAVLARVEAILGRTYSARAHAETAIARARRVGMKVLETWALTALGHVALTTGNYAESAEHLRRVHRLHTDVLDAGDLWYQGDLMEALLAIGAVDETAEVVAEVTAKADLSRSKWGAAVARRGQGMLHGRPDDLRQSAEELAALGAPFEQARSLLLLGERHGDHEASRAALRIFEGIGAEPWAAQARRIAGPIAPTSSSLASRLTNDELRVAVAIARGRTNRQVADELYLSPKTVDAYFETILPKLGVRDRAELTLLVTRDMEQTPI
jgi:DNA-binding CsgD family transcriptional regulator/DNA replicative helicase MCM subunit Mcm2 (Cdc46/Mcm family)